MINNIPYFLDETVKEQLAAARTRAEEAQKIATIVTYYSVMLTIAMTIVLVVVIIGGN